MKLFIIIAAIFCFLVGLIAFFVWSGVYNVSARVPHRDITLWLLEEVREQSISTHSKQIPILSSKNPERINIGFRNYHAMCRICHGAPGYPESEIASGLYPKPPELTSKDVQGESDAELYWIIENGIKMTGMPAFGPTHSKDELWGIVAFVRHLPNLIPKEYQALVKKAGFNEEEEDHHHDQPHSK